MVLKDIDLFHSEPLEVTICLLVGRNERRLLAVENALFLGLRLERIDSVQRQVAEVLLRPASMKY